MFKKCDYNHQKIKMIFLNNININFLHLFLKHLNFKAAKKETAYEREGDSILISGEVNLENKSDLFIRQFQEQG